MHVKKKPRLALLDKDVDLDHLFFPPLFPRTRKITQERSLEGMGRGCTCGCIEIALQHKG